MQVETTTLGRVLDAINAGHRGHMDYLSLDVEGAEYEILESFPWEERSFGVITVEHSYIQANREKIKRRLVLCELPRNSIDQRNISDANFYLEYEPH